MANKWPLRLLRFGYLTIILAILIIFRGALLTGLAEMWIVNDHLEKADAIVVLGGGVQYRTIEAARLYHQGFAAKIVAMDVQMGTLARLGLVPAEREMTRRVLVAKGVAESDIIFIGRQVANTHEEALAVSDWITKTGAKRIIIPTDLFHTRRVHWYFQKTLKKIGIDVRVFAIIPIDYQSTNWWRKEEGLITFQNEFIKFLRYLVIY